MNLNIRKSIALMKIGFKVSVAYRFHTVVTLIMTPISLIVYYFLWKSIFAYTGQTMIRGFTFESMVGYYVLSMIIAFFTWSNVDKWMEYDIRYGHLIFKLLQPIGHAMNDFIVESGFHAYTILIEAVPIFLIGYFFFYLPITSALNIILFIFSVAMAAILYFQLSYCVGLSAFWLKRIDGIRRMKSPLIAFLSGGILPLTFFPAWYTKIHMFLPFQYVRYVPIMVYLNKIPIVSILFMMLGQLIWVVLLGFLIKGVWKLGYKKFSGVGT